LDYPIWGALTTRLRDIAEGDGLVWRYPVAIAPFAAVTDLSAASFAALHSLIAGSDRVALFTPEPVVPPDEFEVQMAKTCEQMVGSVPDARAGGPEMVVVGPDDVPATSNPPPDCRRPVGGRRPGSHYGLCGDGKNFWPVNYLDKLPTDDPRCKGFGSGRGDAAA
jgi:hypothetical protein